MNYSRYFMHPMILHPRSRLLLIWFSIWSLVVGGIFYFITYQTIQHSGIDVTYDPPTPNFILGILLSKYVQVGILLLTTLFASALTARVVVGPINRIYRWVERWKNGAPIEPLQVRKGDKYEQIVSLLNDLRKTH